MVPQSLACLAESTQKEVWTFYMTQSSDEQNERILPQIMLIAKTSIILIPETIRINTVGDHADTCRFDPVRLKLRRLFGSYRNMAVSFADYPPSYQLVVNFLQTFGTSVYWQ